MPRPSQIEAQRNRLLPIVARAFGELGYRRATTAELARRCRVQENILYRIWRDKRSMFIASIEHVYENSVAIWRRQLEKASRSTGRSASMELLDYEAEHIGEFGQYRIVFAGLNETDDEEIRGALGRMYEKFHGFILSALGEERPSGPRGRGSLTPELAAWTLIGLGTLVTIGRELGLLSPALRRRLLKEVGTHLLEGLPRGDRGG